jgi:hypothetical protein
MADLESLLTVPEFARRYPNIVPSEQSVRWLLRNRATNGLLECGAVLEVRRDPRQPRPRILINPPKLIPWLFRRNPRALDAA